MHCIVAWNAIISHDIPATCYPVRMADVDLNLLPALNALLAEGSVAGAARRLGLSTSAMSRTLTRLREATGDPLLVRAGRAMVPTPRAMELRQQVREVAHAAQAILRPAGNALDLSTLERTFTIRANHSFVEAFGSQLIAAVAQDAPGIRLRFAPKPDKTVAPLREGIVDLEIGVVNEMGPEVRIQALFRDHWVGAARQGHPLVWDAPITLQRYVAWPHVIASRLGQFRTPVDAALAAEGLACRVAAVVPSFSAALSIARTSDLVTVVPRSALLPANSAARSGAGAGIQEFPLPVPTETITVSQIWHPRMEADSSHRWLRGLVLSMCRMDAQKTG
jgi:DNA-binding transcriptional LysR family regulator